MLFDIHISKLNKKIMGMVLLFVISKLNKKVMGMLLFINQISEKIDRRTRIIVIKSLIFSLINYCISIRESTYKTLLSNVQKIENFAARVALGGARKYDHGTPVMKELE